MTRPLLIAIDGPAASGKSSTGAAVARALGLPHVDSGALYRAVTWRALAAEVTDSEAIVRAADQSGLALALGDDRQFVVTHHGQSIESAIRSAPVTAHVSAVSAMPAVRDWVNQRLRESLAETGGVMDGRDIGTVVFPAADLKVFLTATPEARARRRLRQAGQDPLPEDVMSEAERLATRDHFDSTREVAPLRQAPDARLLDTTELTFDEQVEQILQWAAELA